MSAEEQLERVRRLRDRWKGLLAEPLEEQGVQPTPRRVLERCVFRLSEILDEEAP